MKRKKIRILTSAIVQAETKSIPDESSSLKPTGSRKARGTDRSEITMIAMKTQATGIATMTKPTSLTVKDTFAKSIKTGTVSKLSK